MCVWNLVKRFGMWCSIIVSVDYYVLSLVFFVCIVFGGCLMMCLNVWLNVVRDL